MSYAIQNGGVTADKIADGAVISSKIENGGIIDVKYANNSIPSSAYGSLSIGNNAYGAITITRDKMYFAGASQNAAANGLAISPTCSTFSSTSSSYVQVTNLAIAIVTTGRPVLIMMQPDGSSTGCDISSGSNSIEIIIQRNGSTNIGAWFLNSSSILPLQFNFIDTPAATNNSYNVYAKSLTGSAFSINYYTLVAFEL